MVPLLPRLSRLFHPSIPARTPTRRLRGKVVQAIATVAALAIVAAACGDDGDNGDEAAGLPGDGPTESTSVGEDLDWTDCYQIAQCATLEVPLDEEDPEGATVGLGVTLVPASGDRIGPLFVNPGGPGGEVSEFAISMAMGFPDEITERFDIVGVDPRGLGQSEIDCGYDYADLYGVDPTIESPEGRDALLEVSQDYVDQCYAAVGDDLRHFGTRDVARDMDAVREALGDDQLNYLGYSYGTSIGQAYADRYPERIRTMVLDGVVEVGKTGLESAEEQALGFESALSAFVADCDADGGCPLAPDALGAVRELIDAVEAEPIPASPRDLGPGELSTGMALPLYSEELWPSLARGVAEALEGDGSTMVALSEQYLNLASFDVYFAVNCLDFVWPEDPDELLAAGAASAEVAPHFGEALVNDYVRCSLWPVEGEPLTEVTAPGAAPILVVSTTNDPATPYEAGVAVAEKLESGVLLTHDGEGHGIVAFGNACVDEVTFGYLLDLEVPEDGTVC